MHVSVSVCAREFECVSVCVYVSVSVCARECVCARMRMYVWVFSVYLGFVVAVP